MRDLFGLFHESESDNIISMNNFDIFPFIGGNNEVERIGLEEGMRLHKTIRDIMSATQPLNKPLSPIYFLQITNVFIVLVFLARNFSEHQIMKMLYLN